MLYILFTTMRDIFKITVIPVILVTIIAPLVVGWLVGKGGGRSLEDNADKSRLPTLLVALLGGLAFLHIATLIFGKAAVQSGFVSNPGGFSDTLGKIFLGPSNIDRQTLGLFGGLTLFLAAVGVFVMNEFVRDGGFLREKLDYLRDPGRTRGQSGSAHFASPREFARFRKPDKGGLPIVGAFWGAKQGKDGKRHYIRLDQGQGKMWLSGGDISRGILTIGGPGSGKTQSVILPSIADHMDLGHSIIVVDPQGELTDHVKKYAAVTRHQVIVHDPTSTTGPRYNLASGIENISDARSIAEVLVPDEGGDNKFWSDSASMLLSGALMRYDNLGDIYTSMSDMQGVGQRMAEKDDDASRLANSFMASLETDGKIASNVVAVLATSLTGWADSVVRVTTSDSDFNARMIVDQPTAVVLTCPGRQRAIYAPYLGAVLRKLMLDLDTIGEENKGPLPIPVGVILDEFPTLGKLDSLVADVNLVRKRKISIMIAAQTKGQFHMIYGQDGTDALFAGMATQIVFGGSDQETADFYSRASGQSTEIAEDKAAKQAIADLDPDKFKNSGQKMQRQLLTSDEIQTPTRGNATIFTRYVTDSYATQLILWAKLTRAYQREDWLKRLENVSLEDAMVIQRPLTFTMPQASAEPEVAPGK